MEAQSKKSRDLNLNPLAPAQSKRTFPFSGETQKIIEKASISAPFFSPFLTLFRGVSRKPEKGAQGPAREPQKHTKMDPKGAQTEPKNQQTERQGPTKYEKHVKMSHQGWQSGAPSITMESQGPPKCKKSTKMVSRVLIRHENMLQRAEKHRHTWTQTTNEGNKGRHESANKQTNEQTPPYTFTQAKTLTTRPLDH